MRLYRIARQHGLAAPVSALVVASLVCVSLIAYRIVVGSTAPHAYLVWNLLLAWFPLAFALLAQDRFRETDTPRDAKFLGLGIAWLLFFPNAPYIFTDLVHVLAKGRPTFWTELMLVLITSMTGFLAGFLSLRLMHGLAARLWGRGVGWLFVAGVSGLAAFGVYLGRFTRLNSWDVVLNPVALVRRTGWAAWNLATEWQQAKFFILFSVFLLLGYVMLFSLTHRQVGNVLVPGKTPA
jgi:uncharacterized membrane protein